jgi:hypothetical protein
MYSRIRQLSLAAAFVAAPCAFAGQAYLGIGLPGVSAGYAHPVSERWMVRGDITTLGRHTLTRTDGGIDYDAKLQAHRLGLFADWFAYRGLRLTGGVTLNDARVDMTGRATGGTIDIGGTSYATGPDDRLDVTLKFPKLMPYLGIGWNSRDAAAGATARGWGLALDLGLAFGKPRVDAQVLGPLLQANVSQADLDREVAEIRDDIRRIKGIPQASVAVTYRF